MTRVSSQPRQNPTTATSSPKAVTAREPAADSMPSGSSTQREGGVDARRATERQLSDATRSINNALRGHVGSDDVDAVLAAIARLPAADARPLLEQLAASGGMDALHGAADEYQRRSLLDLLARKGMVAVEPGEVRSGHLDPPSLPNRYRAPNDAPECVRKMVESENVADQAEYQGAYREYAARYGEAVRAAATPEDLVRLGEPVCANNEERDAVGMPWFQKLKELSGQAAPGTFYAYGKVEAQLGVERVERRVDVRQDGLHDSGTERSLGLGIKAPGGEVGAVADHDGKSPEVTVGVGPISVTVSEEAVETEVGFGNKAPDGYEGIAEAEVAAVSRVKKDGSVEAGVKAGAKVLGQGVEAEVGAGASLATRQGIEDGRMTMTGFWDHMAMARNGFAWSRLPAQERAELERLGVTEKTWNAVRSESAAMSASRVGFGR